MGDRFEAVYLTENDGKVSAEVKTLATDNLPEGEVMVEISHSTINYKDGMIIKGLGRLVRDYPHVPGIDFSGEVLESADDLYKPGDKVVLTGWRVGEIHWGGLAGRARVRANWLTPLPVGLSEREAMAVGTAGFTAMLCVLGLENNGVSPASGPVLVTGASGGVGSVAVAILAELGYEVAAVTGRPETADYLQSLGAGQIIAREEMSEPAKPLEKETWAGVVDTVAGPHLAKALAQTRYGGVVSACGLAATPRLECTVMPFLLRGVKLIGIDSVMQPRDNRPTVWNRIATDLPRNALAEITHPHSLADALTLAGDILAGQVRGRAVIDMSL